MDYPTFKNRRPDRLGWYSHRTRSVALLLVLLPILFANLETGFSSFKASSHDLVINYYSPNPISYEAYARTRPLSFLEGPKNKRSSFYWLSLLYASKNVFNLKTKSNVEGHPSPYNISPKNLKLKYLLLDLPPPSNRPWPSR